MGRVGSVWILAVLVGCGSARDDAHDAADSTGDGATTDDAGPAVSCGCPDDMANGSCVSLNVFEWVDRTPVGPGDGLTVYVVDEDNYDQRTSALATGVPDAMGRVVIDGFTPTPGQKTFVVLDDDAGAVEESWSHVGLGPIEVPGNAECIEAPALSKTHGDTIFLDTGHDPNGGSILGGTVILEVLDQDGQLRELIGLDSAPEYGTHYFTDDRQHVDRFLTSTTSSGAVLIGPVYVCSPLCRNMDCDCTEFPCGVRAAERGGAGNGFFFSSVACHR